MACVRKATRRSNLLKRLIRPFQVIAGADKTTLCDPHVRSHAHRYVKHSGEVEFGQGCLRGKVGQREFFVQMRFDPFDDAPACRGRQSAARTQCAIPV